MRKKGNGNGCECLGQESCIIKCKKIGLKKDEKLPIHENVGRKNLRFCQASDFPDPTEEESNGRFHFVTPEEIVDPDATNFADLEINSNVEEEDQGQD
ncbi:MAG: hypothetical protein ACOYMB_00455 [Patescibacteria group bacterium]